MTCDYDVAVIGGGIVGTAVAEQLSRYNARVCLIERSTDVADGTTKANSGIVHAGYDAKPGTMMARLNVRGSRLMPQLCARMGVPYAKCGSLVLSLCEDDDAMLETLLERGMRNGVENLRILSRSEVLEMEPNITPDVRGALYAEDAAIVDPFALAAALAETACLNGTDVLLESEVAQIRRDGDCFVIEAGEHTVRSGWIVNAAGVHADAVHEMAGGSGWHIRPVRGEYYLLDKSEGTRVGTVVFQCPSVAGKGVLVAPTVHGNLIVGPNARECADPDDTATSAEGQQFVKEQAKRSVPGIDYRAAIRNFAGMRAYSDTGDFVIEMSSQVPHFINLAGICSPGLTSAPAIAQECVELLKDDGLTLERRADYRERPAVPRMRDLAADEASRYIAQDPRYGHVICRCETVTEGEIADVLRRKPVPRTVDGIKKRLGAGMGRCQGGFCLPRIVRILSEELQIAPEDVLLGGAGSNILIRREENTTDAAKPAGTTSAAEETA